MDDGAALHWDRRRSDPPLGRRSVPPLGRRNDPPLVAGLRTRFLGVACEYSLFVCTVGDAQVRWARPRGAHGGARSTGVPRGRTQAGLPARPNPWRGTALTRFLILHCRGRASALGQPAGCARGRALDWSPPGTNPSGTACTPQPLAWGPPLARRRRTQWAAPLRARPAGQRQHPRQPRRRRHPQRRRLSPPRHRR